MVSAFCLTLLQWKKGWKFYSYFKKIKTTKFAALVVFIERLFLLQAVLIFP
ncbi:hypothetical protein ELI_1257 [Eubacterium callanderi]|uniref:Uncharacterized protein n=1 Tax=Eubacterium callanderi TaxID=53442 RepID=E3GL01_9FIRM|nr:hypothetical protein ELI_1257 [Eubacterium callanderi]